MNWNNPYTFAYDNTGKVLYATSGSDVPDTWPTNLTIITLDDNSNVPGYKIFRNQLGTPFAPLLTNSTAAPTLTPYFQVTYSGTGTSGEYGLTANIINPNTSSPASGTVILNNVPVTTGTIANNVLNTVVTVNTQQGAQIEVSASGIYPGAVMLPPSVNTFSGGITGSGTTGTLTAGPGILNNTNIFEQEQVFNKGISLVPPVSFSYPSNGNGFLVGSSSDITNGSMYGLAIAAPAGTGIWPLGVMTGGGSTAARAFAVTNTSSVLTLHNTLDDGAGNVTFSVTGVSLNGLTGNSNDGRSINVVPSASPGSWNSMVQSGDSVIQFNAGNNAGALTLTAWSSTKAGLRLTATGVVNTANNTLDDGTGSMVVNTNLTINNTMFLKSVVAGINNAQITSGNPTVAGVTGQLFSIAEENVAWVFALDATGNLGLGNSLYANGIKAGTMLFAGNAQGNASPFGQGAYIGWNYNAGQGETDFMNNKGGGGGGFNFYNGAGSTWTEIAEIDGTGNLTVANRISLTPSNRLIIPVGTNLY